MLALLAPGLRLSGGDGIDGGWGPTCACVVGVQDELVAGGCHFVGLLERGVRARLSGERGVEDVGSGRAHEKFSTSNVLLLVLLLFEISHASLTHRCMLAC